MNENKSAARKDFTELSEKLRADGSSGSCISMTYQDYRDAAYSYKTAAERTQRYASELVKTKCDYEEKQRRLDLLAENIDSNRERYASLHDGEIDRLRQQWSEQNDELNSSIEEEIEAIKQRADDEVQKLRDEYISRSADLNEVLKPLYNQVAKYEEEIEELMDTESMLADFSSEQLPVENAEVLSFLKRALDKRLLSRFQREVMGRPCDRVIGSRKDFRLFEDVLNEERKFASSKRYRELKEGRVTEAVRFKAATAASAAAILLFVLLLLPGITTNHSALSIVVEGMLMIIAGGGFAVNMVKSVFLKMFFEDISENKKNNAKTAALFSGMLTGFGIWLLLFTSRGGIGLVLVLLALTCTFFCLRKSMVSLVGLDTLNRVGFFRDLTRRDIFREMTEKRKGRYNLQMYCYLNHDAVIDYMSMNYRDNVYVEVSNRLELAQRSLKVAKKQLAEHKEELKKLKDMRSELKQSISHIRLECSRAIQEAENKRQMQLPDFEKILPDNIAKELAGLDEEYKRLEEERAELSPQTKAADNLYSQTEIRSMAAEKRFNMVRERIREWNATPTPHTTEFTLSDLFCFESSDNINIVKHNLEPFVFRYSIGKRTDNPAKYLRQVIYRCIKGLVKINPSALMQINIVDTVSDPAILREYEELGSFTENGLITGICTADEFELRLFDSRKSYKSFRALFNSQCYDVRDFLDENTGRLTKDMDRSLLSANQLKDNEDEPFVYQIMMYIVPREYDDTDFAPPEELVRAMRNGTCISMGILPFFFVDSDSVHEKWQEAVSLCNWSCEIGRKRG